MLTEATTLTNESSNTTNEVTLKHEHLVTTWITNPYLSAATSNNTRKAYRSDIQHYERWGGKLPATPETIINYLQAFATSLNPRTLSRRLIALKHWHTYQGFLDPTGHPIVAKTMIGIARIHGKPKEKAPPLTPEDLQRICEVLLQNPSLLAIRDIALLQIGFFGALRRSELVSIRYEHIRWEKEGVEIVLPSSKTDQTHEGQYCTIPYGNEVLCPVKALQQWLNKTGITEGAIFRRITSNKLITTKGLTPLSVNHIIRRCAEVAALRNASLLSPHSLRRGLATSAARANASVQVIMRAGRWKQVNTVMEYIEASERFTENAAGSVLQKIQQKTS